MPFVTYVPSVYQPAMFHSVTPETIYASIIDGTFDDFQSRLDNADLADRAKRKRELPAVCWNGIFTMAVTNANFAGSSSLVTMDFDGVVEPKDLLFILCQLPSVVLAFVSPGGNGVKCCVYVQPAPQTPETYKQAWLWVRNYLEKVTGYPVDTSGSDVRRLCYVAGSKLQENSFCKLLTKELASLTPYTWQPKCEGNPHFPKRDIRHDLTYVPADSRIRDALTCIPSDDYDIWIKVGMALKSAESDIPQAMLLWDIWSSGSTKYRPEEIHRKWKSFVPSKINLGAVINLARQYGLR